MRGGSAPIIYSEYNLHDRYLDECTGKILPPHLIRDAIIDEPDYFNETFWKLSSKEEMEAAPDYIFVRRRRVLCNKGDAESPNVRDQLISCELNKDDKQDDLAASTPPLEGKKILFSRYAQLKDKKGKPMHI